MMLCRQAAATPVRPRQLARRRPVGQATVSATAAVTSRRRTASANNESACGLDTAADGAATNQGQLKAFAAAMNRPASSQETMRSFDLLRALLPYRFAELCKVHLSFLIDVPADFLDADSEVDANHYQQQQHQTPGRWLRHHVRSSIKMKLQCTRTDAQGPEVRHGAATTATGGALTTSPDLAAIDTLLSLLALHSASVEGLFRKCGSASRQRRLLNSLLAPADAGPADAAGWSPHDLAGALKASLAGLAEPLLTHRLLPYFQQVARLGAPAPCGGSDAAPDEGRDAILAARRLKGFRLLVQLLPADRRALLGRLLALLSRTGCAPDTRMTPESLGTVFGPALLYPHAADAEDGGDSADRRLGDARHLAAAHNSAVAFIIRHADSVMLIPESIAQDADQILRRIRRRPASEEATAIGSEDVVSLSVRFAESASAATATSSSAAAVDRRRRPGVEDEFTRSQVAALFAAVQAMPDSAKRRRLIRRFNRTNGGLPAAQGGPAASAASSPSVASSLSSLSPPSASPLISSPVFGRTFDFPLRCLSPDPEM